MSWKERYERTLLDVSENGTRIYKDGYYLIDIGSNFVKGLKTFKGVIVKITKLDLKTWSVWFNHIHADGQAYMWNTAYKEYIVREATPNEIIRFKKKYPELDAPYGDNSL
jgi:hypothetical protein